MKRTEFFKNWLKWKMLTEINCNGLESYAFNNNINAPTADLHPNPRKPDNYTVPHSSVHPTFTPSSQAPSDSKMNSLLQQNLPPPSSVSVQPSRKI